MGRMQVASENGTGSRGPWSSGSWMVRRGRGSGSAADLLRRAHRDAVDAERLGYRYYFFIEHQNAPFAYISSPNVYLAALARETTTLRFGPMVYQLPMYHPIRLAQDAAMVDQLSHGRLEFGAGYGTQAHEFVRWNLRSTSGARWAWR